MTTESISDLLNDEPVKYALQLSNMNIIKVIGVGGGGCNAVKHMYLQGIKDVTFVVCNTDDQALRKSPVPTQIQLGPDVTFGLGAGSKPERAREAAEASLSEIEKMLADNTRMAFITAGMGGGTGTGAAPVIAEAARKLGILTVGIVTIPFEFEGKQKIKQALRGVVKMSRHVDALLVIHNDKLRTIYPNFKVSQAFAYADDVLTQAAKGIAEIITEEGYINIDFADVYTTMKDGGVAVMNTGRASGERRVSRAIENALDSPLLNNNNIKDSKKILLNIYNSTTNEVQMKEFDEIHEFMEQMGDDIEVIWGAAFDSSLGDDVKITLIATGAGMEMIPPELRNEANSIETLADSSTDLSTDTESVPTPPTVATAKPVQRRYTGAKLADDPTDRWMKNLYPDKNNPDNINRLACSLEELDDNETLKMMVETPAFKRFCSEPVV